MSTDMTGWCALCRAGSHNTHNAALGGICVGCACPVTAADRPSVKPGPWTSHGHDIPGVTDAGTPRPARARCGGPSLCAQCSREAVAADRPSVTDNARAGQCPDHKPVQHRDGKPPWCNRCGLTAAGTTPPEPAWAAGRAETPAGLTVSEDGSVLNWQGVNYVPQPAETTTATTEDMTTRLAAAEAELDRLCNGGRFIMSIPAREGYDSDLLIQAALSDLRALLATARTRPTRDDLAQALAEAYGPAWASAIGSHYEAADAVLALLGGDDK